ncbi:MAG TPA: tail fiber domain-containing protein, partial [Candidatus Paceibacterota bacterium]|nr:tail fiber domain-containing protein [Candidatus Paceibacterota bacterium]
SVRAGGGVRLVTGSAGVTVNGPVNATAFNNTSDARLKKDVQPIGDALALVSALRGVTFNWDSAVDPTLGLDGRNHIGFLAQEVELVLPQIVVTANDARQTKAVAYSEVIPVLTEAIKRLKAENDTLQAQNADILQRLEALEARLGK